MNFQNQANQVMVLGAIIFVIGIAVPSIFPLSSVGVNSSCSTTSSQVTTLVLYAPNAGAQVYTGQTESFNGYAAFNGSPVNCVAITPITTGGTYTGSVVFTNANGNFSFTATASSTPTTEFWQVGTGVNLGTKGNTVTVRVLQNPVSDTASCTAPSAQTVTCTAQGSNGVGPYLYLWNWGDGSPGSTGKSATHSFTATGTFNVNSTVVDTNGLAASQFVPVTITSITTVTTTTSTTALGVDFICTNSAGSSTVTCNGQGFGGAGRPYAYLWAWGDGTSSKGGTKTHAYISPGTYVISVTVTDPNGATFTNQTSMALQFAVTTTQTATVTTCTATSTITILAQQVYGTSTTTVTQTVGSTCTASVTTTIGGGGGSVQISALTPVGLGIVGVGLFMRRKK